MKAFRLLRADEIEVRVARATEKGATLLLYKTARTDADLLDETFGPQNWQNDFKVVDGTLYGGIGIFQHQTVARSSVIESYGEWVWKWDAGTESNTEAEKGRASDAFKRAGFKWGLGRELYTAPFTFVPAGRCNLKESNGRFQCFDNFEVTGIDYDEQERISFLEISLKDKVVFSYGEPRNAAATLVSADAPQETPETPCEATEVRVPLVCADCGKVITNGKKRDGSVWHAEAIAAYTKRFAKRTLCAECGKKEKERQEADNG